MEEVDELEVVAGIPPKEVAKKGRKASVKKVKAKKKITVELDASKYYKDDVDQFLEDFVPNASSKEKSGVVTVTITDTATTTIPEDFSQEYFLKLLDENIGRYTELRIRKSEERRVRIKEHKGRFFLKVLSNEGWDSDDNAEEEFEIFL